MSEEKDWRNPTNNLCDAISQKQNGSAVALSDGLANLVNSQDEYIRLLTMEIHEMSSYVSADGWKSTKIEEGKRLLEEIARARKQVG